MGRGSKAWVAEITDREGRHLAGMCKTRIRHGSRMPGPWRVQSDGRDELWKSGGREACVLIRPAGPFVYTLNCSTICLRLSDSLESSWALRLTWELLVDISFIETLTPAMSLEISADTDEPWLTFSLTS